MLNPRLLPVVPRMFTAAGLTDVDCITARPGYSKRLGGPSLTSNAAHDTADDRRILPTRIRFQTNGDIKMRYLMGPQIGDAAGMYYDVVVTGFAGEWLDLCPDIIVATGTTADFEIGWPR